MPRNQRRFAVTLVLLVGLLLVSGAPAATILVPQEHPTIQAAINAANPGDTILVDAGTYQEDVTIDRPIVLQGNGAKSLMTITGGVVITSSNVDISNVSITNPTGKYAITATDHSNLTITNNNIYDIGTADATTSGSNWGIAIVSNAAAVDNVVITGNTITNVAGGANKTAQGIVIGWSTGAFDVTGLVIEENTITNIRSMDGANPGRGAYGILINHASPAHAGKTVSPAIRNNTIQGLEGLWAHAIGLEGDMPNALVEGNFIADLVDYKDPSDAVGVFVEDNAFAGTVTVLSNSITNATWSVAVHPITATGTVNASANYHGATNLELNVTKVAGNVDYTPWLDSGVDASADPGFQGTYSVLWVAALSPQTGSLGRIQEALALVDGSTIHVTAGTYLENVTVPFALSLLGAGSATTTIQGSGGVVLALPAGNSAVDRMIASGLTLTGGVTGVTAGSYTTLTDIAATGNTTYGINLANLQDLRLIDSSFSSNDVGLKIASAVTVTDLVVDGCAFDNNTQHGWYSDASSSVKPDLDNVLVKDTSFSGNALKGFYTERLSNAVFDGIVVNNSGSTASYAWGAGIDINLKWKSYQNIQVLDAIFTNCGLGSTNGVALTIKARDDAPSYGPPNAATLDGVTVEDSYFDGNERGIVFGEPGKNNAGPTNAVVVNNSLINAAVLELVNHSQAQTTASCNWWGSLVPAAVAARVSGDAIWWPWLAATPGLGVPCDQYPGDNVSVGDATACLTPDNPCVLVPVILNREDTTASRGVSVTFQLSPELVLCGAPSASVVAATGAGSWLGGLTNWNLQVVDNGSGSYTADLAILGVPCGPTTGGVLFNVSVAAAVVGVETTGTITVTDVLVRDCNNAPLPGVPGAPGSVNIDDLAPVALASLAAVQQKTGNPAGATTNINLSWTAPTGDADVIQIWRKGFGFYPEYDDGGGTVPVAPVTLGNGWTLVTTVPAATTSYVDYTTARDFYYYAAYVLDACGNKSPVSALTTGALNYHLGDVSDGTTPGTGDNEVDSLDISALGGAYGLVDGNLGYLNFLDVGPTTDFSVDGRPLTDNRIQFEDLMMFAINYEEVGKASFTPPPPAITNAVTLIPGQAGDPGTTFDVEVRLAADGQIQGLSVPLTWDSAVVEPVGLRAGDLLPAQGGQHLVAAPEAGTVDAAIFGVRDRGISGEGSLAFVTFRVKAAGDPRIGLGTIDARDAENQTVQLFGSTSSTTPSALPSMSALAGAMPNPFNPATELSFAIAREGTVKLGVYTLRGQLVRTLVQEHRAAGHYTVTWNGTDNAGQTVASGSYVVRLVAPDRTQSQRITLVK